MRALAMTGMVTAFWISWIFFTGDMRATPPSLRMSEGTRSSAITDAAPASSAILACSALVTSMMTPPLSISASPMCLRSAILSPLASAMKSPLGFCVTPLARPRARPDARDAVVPRAPPRRAAARPRRFCRPARTRTTAAAFARRYRPPKTPRPECRPRRARAPAAAARPRRDRRAGAPAARNRPPAPSTPRPPACAPSAPPPPRRGARGDPPRSGPPRDGALMPRAPRQQPGRAVAPEGQSRRIVSARLAVEEFRRLPLEQALERVHARAGVVAVHRQQRGAERAEHLHGARVRRLLDGDRVARIEQRARDQVEPLLRAVDDQDVLGARLEPEAQQIGGEVPAERRVAAHGIVLQQRLAFLAHHLVEGAAERLGREEPAVGHAAR